MLTEIVRFDTTLVSAVCGCVGLACGFVGSLYLLDPRYKSRSNTLLFVPFLVAMPGMC